MLNFRFEFIFVGIGKDSTSFFCMWTACFLSMSSWKDSCLCLLKRVPSQKPVHFLYEGLFWGHYILLVYMSALMLVSYCFDYCHSVVSFKTRRCEFSYFVLYQVCFGLFRVPWDAIHILGWVHFWKKSHWNFDRNFIETIGHFWGGCSHFHNTQSSNPRNMEDIFPFICP